MLQIIAEFFLHNYAIFTHKLWTSIMKCFWTWIDFRLAEMHSSKNCFVLCGYSMFLSFIKILINYITLDRVCVWSPGKFFQPTYLDHLYEIISKIYILYYSFWSFLELFQFLCIGHQNLNLVLSFDHFELELRIILLWVLKFLLSLLLQSHQLFDIENHIKTANRLFCGVILKVWWFFGFFWLWWWTWWWGIYFIFIDFI